MQRRVTIRDIARALDFHHSTVSLGLRNDPRLPVATRTAIKEMAEKMNYRPDPMVKALTVYRGAIRPVTSHGTLVWLSNECTPQFGADCRYIRYVKGAQARATELGYVLEEFVLRSPGMTLARMTKILQARGLTSILVAPQARDRIRARIRMDWSAFSAVAFGYSLAWPPLHLVTNDQFDSVKMAYRKLNSLGYRRIGFCMNKTLSGRVNGCFLGGYVTAMSRWPKALHIDPLLYETWKPAEFKRWFRANRPEALIMHDATDLECAREALGIAIPEKLAAVSLTANDKGWACVDQNSEAVGAAAVDLLVAMKNSNERGIPAIPRRLLITGRWTDGFSVRRIGDAKRK